MISGTIIDIDLVNFVELHEKLPISEIEIYSPTDIKKSWSIADFPENALQSSSRKTSNYLLGEWNHKMSLESTLLMTIFPQISLLFLDFFKNECFINV